MSALATLLRAPEVRVFGLMLLGLFAVAGVVVATSASALGRPYVTPLSVLGMFVYWSAIWILPAGLPAGALGALLAIRMREREPHGRSLWFWAGRGVAVGAALGAAGTALWWVAMFATEPDHLRRVIGPVTAIGAAAGAGVGLMVALYCWRSRRRLTPP